MDSIGVFGIVLRDIRRESKIFFELLHEYQKIIPIPFFSEDKEGEGEGDPKHLAEGVGGAASGGGHRSGESVSD